MPPPSMGQNLAPPAPQPIRAIWSSQPDLRVLDPPGTGRARRSTSGAGLARGIVCLSRAHRGAGSYDSFTGRAAPRFYHGRPGPGTKAEPGVPGAGRSTTVRVAGPVCAVIHRLCLPPEARRAILLTTLDTTPQRHLSRGAVDNRPSSQNTSFHLRLVDVSLARGSRSRGARLTSPKSATAASDTISATPLRVLS